MKKYCVTGGSGYIGSWLVNSLLQTGYMVHATIRDPAKSSHLLKIWGDSNRLRLFRADLQEEGSFDEAVKGCNGVFHVAASMELNVPENQNSDSYVEKNIIEPAIRGTLNLLKSCAKAKTVKRVVFTSSISTMTAKDSTGQWKPVVDESCQQSIDQAWNSKTSGWVYMISKLQTEETAFKFANENGIDLVSVITTTVGGPFLTPTVPLSIRVLLSPITGDDELYSVLSAVNSRMGSIALVHIEDTCNAHMFLMQNPQAKGRFICCTHSSTMSELITSLQQEYPCSDIKRVRDEENEAIPPEISSKKLRDLGFNYKYGLQDIIHETVTSCVDYGFLPRISK